MTQAAPENPAEFATALVYYCTALGASVTSYIRSRKHNEHVGGVPHSAHKAGLAADVVYDEPIPLVNRLRTAESVGLTLISEGDHDHLQPSNWPAG